MSTPEPMTTAERAVTIDRRPTITSSVVAIVAVTIAMALIVPYFILAIPFGLAALGFVAGGVLVTGSRGWVSLGVTSGFLAILLVALLTPIDPLSLAIAAVGVFLAWDVGHYAITIGQQFGRGTRTQRGEIVHAAGSAVVGTIGVGVTYVVYLVGTGEQPTLAVFFLVAGVIALIWALRD